MPMAGIASAILTAVALLGWRATRRQALTTAVLLAGAWIIGFATIAYYGYSQNADQFYPNRQDADRLADDDYRWTLFRPNLGSRQK